MKDELCDGAVSREQIPKTRARTRKDFDRMYLRKAVRPSLKDNQKNPDWHSDLLQEEVRSHPCPAQHTPHAVLRSDRYLTQTNGQAIEFRWRQAEAL